MKTIVCKSLRIIILSVLIISCTSEEFKKTPVNDSKYKWLEVKDSDSVLNYININNEFADSILNNNFKLYEELREDMLTDYVSYPSSKIPEANKSKSCFVNSKGFLQCKSNDNDTTELLNLSHLTKGYIDVITKFNHDSTYISIAIDSTGKEFYGLFIYDLKKKKLSKQIHCNVAYLMEWATDNNLYFSSIDTSVNRWNELNVFNLNSFKVERIYKEKRTSTHVYPTRLANGKIILNRQGENFFDQSLLSNGQIKNVCDSREGVFSYIKSSETGIYLLSNIHNEYYDLFKINNENSNYSLNKIYKGKKEMLLRDFLPVRDKIILKGSRGVEVFCKILDCETLDLSDYHYKKHCNFDLDYFDFLSDSIVELTFYPSTSPHELHYINIYDLSSEIIRPEYLLPETFCANTLESKIVYSISPDGKKIPISLLYKKGLQFTDSTPIELQAYGAYGSRISVIKYSLLNWPFLNECGVLAYAHIRGGGEYGDSWHSSSMYGNKMVSVNDLLYCTEYLIEQGYTSKGNVFLYGVSAGGVVTNRAFVEKPELFGGICNVSPFIDVYNTMADSTIFGVTTEYDEWGNPNSQEVKNKMLNYDPYQNVEPNDYPIVIYFMSYNDTRVMYWGIAKMAERIRDNQRGNAPVLLFTDKNGGHTSSDYPEQAAVRFTMWLSKAESN